jgi:heme-degrading monooxygenase HmoA
MAVLMDLEIETTPEQYDAVDQAMNPKADPPDGLIAHSARQEGDKMHIVDIWESPEAFGAFAQSRLGPTIAQTLGDDAPPAPEPKFTELHNAYSA